MFAWFARSRVAFYEGPLLDSDILAGALSPRCWPHLECTLANDCTNL
jgi:hypothetical protein